MIEGHSLSDKYQNVGVGAIIRPEEKAGMLPFIRSSFGNLSERDMARRLGVGKTAVNRWRRELGLVIKKNTANENFFKGWTPRMAYILGYVFADGNVNWNPKKSYRALTITAAEKDKNHLENVRAALHSTKVLLYSKNTKSYRLVVNNKTICKDLMRLGVIPRKSRVVKFPEVPKSLLRHFVRGVIDGDGSVRYVNRSRSPYFEIVVCSGSKIFLEKMAKKISRIGISGRVWKNNNGVFILQYTCRRGMALAKWIYGNEGLCLDRKFQQYETALRARGGEQL